MSDLRLRLSPAWQSTRDDELDTYEVSDSNEAVVALVPIGNNITEMNRQRAILQLVAAAPVLQSAVDAALVELTEDKPNLERLRALLADAAASSRGA